MENKKNNLVWIDLEFSGLDISKEVILEISTLITDQHLKILAEGPVLAIHQSDEILEAMDEWNSEHHTKSGLVERVRASEETHESAEQKSLQFVSEYCEENTSPLCGNTIHMDRRFLEKYMPKLEAYFHYRNIDVSTIKELAARWYPDLPVFPKTHDHSALADIRESIGELKYYWENVFVRKQ